MNQMVDASTEANKEDNHVACLKEALTYILTLRFPALSAL